MCFFSGRHMQCGGSRGCHISALLYHLIHPRFHPLLRRHHLDHAVSAAFRAVVLCACPRGKGSVVVDNLNFGVVDNCGLGSAAASSRSAQTSWTASTLEASSAAKVHLAPALLS